jgi:hypothetical protein
MSVAPEGPPTEPTDPSPVERTAALVLACILPMLVVWGFLTGIDRIRTESDLREERNVGHVINGRVVGKLSVPEFIDSELEKTEPQIVILGNSLSNTDLNPVQLARHLDIPRYKVQVFSIPNSIGAHWWLVLKNRVFKNNHHPKVVIVLSDMQSLLANKPLTEASYLNLRVHVDDPDDDAYLDQKAGGKGWASSKVWENKGKVREASLKLVRNLWVDLLMRGKLYNGTTNTRDSNAIDRVFDAGSTDLRLHAEVIPIMQTESTLQPFDPSLLPDVAHSFLPEILDMTQEEGTRIVFLRPPYSPLLAPEAGDYVLPEREQEVKDYVSENKGLYLDMRSFDMIETDFINVDHMNDRGAKRFTEAVAQTFDNLDILSRGPQARAARGREIQLFGDIKLVNGQIVQTAPDVRFTHSQTPAIPPYLYDTQIQVGRGDTYYFNARLPFLSDQQTAEYQPLGARCSPVRVYEDGTPLPMPNVSCEEVTKAGSGRVCHILDRIAFAATDNTNPLKNKREYTLGLDSDRNCEGSVWIYPNDSFKIPFPVGKIARMPNGATALRLEAIDMVHPESSKAHLAFRLLVDGVPRLDETFPLGSSSVGEREWLIDPPITGDAKNVRLEVTNQDATFVLFTSAVLSERARGLGN